MEDLDKEQSEPEETTERKTCKGDVIRKEFSDFFGLDYPNEEFLAMRCPKIEQARRFPSLESKEEDYVAVKLWFTGPDLNSIIKKVHEKAGGIKVPDHALLGIKESDEKKYNVQSRPVKGEPEETTERETCKGMTDNEVLLAAKKVLTKRQEYELASGLRELIDRPKFESDEKKYTGCLVRITGMSGSDQPPSFKTRYDWLYERAHDVLSELVRRWNEPVNVGREISDQRCAEMVRELHRLYDEDALLDENEHV